MRIAPCASTAAHTWIEDANGNTIELEYTDTGAAWDLAKSVKDLAGARQFNLKDTNSDGRVEKVTYPLDDSSAAQPANKSWTMLYDQIGRLTGVTMEEGESLTLEYMDTVPVEWPEAFQAARRDNVSRKKDARNVGVSYVYDSEEDLFQTTQSLTGRDIQTREIERFAIGVVGQSEEIRLWRTSGGKSVAGTVYVTNKPDKPLVGTGSRPTGQQWLTSEVKTKWLDGTVWQSRSAYYDHGWDYEDLINGTSSSVGDTLPKSWVSGMKDALGRVTLYAYWDDKAYPKYGRIKKTMSPDGMVTSFDYDLNAMPTQIARSILDFRF